jgi:hypothetical protein
VGKYVLYNSQKYFIEENQYYCSNPNYFQSKKAETKIGFPITFNTNKPCDAQMFSTKKIAKAIMKNKKLTGYIIMPFDKAVEFTKRYDNAQEKRIEKYKKTKEEIEILKEMELN